MATIAVDGGVTAPSPDQQLQGKSNYVVWHPRFKREARDMDVFDILASKEDIITTEPTAAACLVYTDGTSADETAATRSKEVDSARSLLKWQSEHKKWENSKRRVRQARRVLEKWVSPAILLEIEDMDSPVDAYNHVTATYSVTNEFAQEQILRDISRLRLGNRSSMTEFLNEHRVLKARLASVGYTAYSDGQMVTNILFGLPAAYRDFREQYDWIRAKDGDGKHDLEFLFNRLLLKEVSVNKEKAREQAEAKAREQAEAKNTQNSNRSNARNNKDKPDRSHLHCSSCGKNGHDEESCWVTHPERIPKRLQGVWKPPSAPKEASSSITVVKKEQTSSSSSSSNSKGVKPDGLVALCTSSAEFTQALHDLRDLSFDMASLVLSTEGAYLDPSVLAMTSDSQEVMRVLSRALDSRVQQAL